MSWEWEKDLRNCSGSHKWEKREKWEKDLSSALHSDLKGDCGMVGVALSTQAAAIGHGRTTSGCQDRFGLEIWTHFFIESFGTGSLGQSPAMEGSKRKKREDFTVWFRRQDGVWSKVFSSPTDAVSQDPKECTAGH